MKAVIFDFDGLMVDSEVISFKCFRDFLKQYDIPFPKETYVKSYPGKSTKVTLKIFKETYDLDCDLEQAMQQIRDLETKYMQEDGVELKEGLRDLLSCLKESGYRTAIATSSVKDRAMNIIDHYGLRDFFDDFVFGSEVKRGKPYPDIFLKACEKLNIKPKEAIVLEDSEAGIQAASDAHIPVICIPDMKYPAQTYADKAEAVFKSLNDMIDFIKHKA